MSSLSPPVDPPSDDSTSPGSARRKIPTWLPISAFIGTSLALAIPLFMIRRQRATALRNVLKDSTAPPRRAGAAPGRYTAGRASTAPAHGKSAKESSPDFSSPGTMELLSAMSRVDFSTALYAGKAFAIATGLVTVFGVGLTWAVKTSMGVQDAREFGHRIRMVLWSTLPSLTSRIHRPPETDDERKGIHLAGSPENIDSWTWEEAEKRLQKAYDEGGFPLWAQTAMREMEMELRIERARRRKEYDESESSKGSGVA